LSVRLFVGAFGFELVVGDEAYGFVGLESVVGATGFEFSGDATGLPVGFFDGVPGLGVIYDNCVTNALYANVSLNIE
jgi:hypothetical protein